MDAAHRQAYLEAMGITRWQRRDTHQPQPTSNTDDTPAVATARVNPAGLDVVAAAVISDDEAGDLESLEKRVAVCTRCALAGSRTQTVFGVGDPHARLMIIGEAPGAEEDRRGEPFVGRAGQLLNAMLGAIGFHRDQVYIANIVKCRPPGNRNPAADEAAACREFLDRQIELIQPGILLSLGAVSAHNLLQVDTPVSRLRGKIHHYGVQQIPLLVSYHPAYLLRKPAEKAKAWADLQFVLKELQ